MRSGISRGRAVAITLVLVCGPILSARGDGWFHHTIPRETLAMDYRTGDVMMAPPIPGGHYTKDYIGSVKGAAGLTFGAIHGLKGKLAGLCSKCGGPGCGNCGGNGLFHGKSCNSCGGDGCNSCGSGDDGCSLGLGGLLHHGGGALGHLCHKKHANGIGCGGAGCGTFASGQAAPAPAPPAKAAAQAAPQHVVASGQAAPVCGGCLGTGRLAHGGGCGLCGGSGKIHSLLGRHGYGNGISNGCGNCGGRGCGACGLGSLHNGFGHGGGDPGCRNCGGRGCGLCGGLAAKAHGVIGGLYSKITHKGQIQYFVGAGGPVPLTPGFVPYVVSTRSPRDFLAFPPYSDQIP